MPEPEADSLCQASTASQFFLIFASASCLTFGLGGTAFMLLYLSHGLIVDPLLSPLLNEPEALNPKRELLVVSCRRILRRSKEALQS